MRNNRHSRSRPRSQAFPSLLIFAACLHVAIFVGCGQGDSTSQSKKSLAAVDRAAIKNQVAGLMGQFRYDAAVTALRPLCESAWAASDDQVDLAIALLNRRNDEDLAEAAAMLDEVIDQDPASLRARFCRGILLFHEGKSKQAQELFEYIAAKDQRDGYAAYYVGQCLLAQRKFSEAAKWFERAQKVDPYLRSAYYGQFQALQRAGDAKSAQVALSAFQRLAENPRARIAELKYTRMGPKAEVTTVDSVKPLPTRPKGSLFSKVRPLPILEAPSLKWRSEGSKVAPSITVADTDGDALLDLFVTNASDTGASTLLRNRGDAYEAIPGPHDDNARPVQAALWGDYDDDGLVDVYFCKQGPNQLWRQAEVDKWIDVTEAVGVAGGDDDTIDGLCYDFDHDGDLDYLLVNRDGPRELFSNDRTGRFRSIAAELGIQGTTRGSKGGSLRRFRRRRRCGPTDAQPEPASRSLTK